MRRGFVLTAVLASVLSMASPAQAANVVQVASLVVQSALRRKESRGLHYTTDYPDAVESERHDTVLRRSTD